jgi:hypothetical protein
MVFPLIIDPLEWLNWMIVEGRRTQICRTGITRFEMFLQQQIVGSRHMVVFIRLNTPLSVFNIKLKLLQFLQNNLVDRYPMIANNDATI